jgi:tetratricopeptide (TPR) repeat protein
MADDKNVNYPEEDFADLLFRYSRFLYLHGRYEKAIVLYDRLIKIKGEVWTQELEVPYRDIADSCFRLGYYEKSLNFLLKSVCNQEIILGEEDSRTKITYHWIGRIYSILGHYDKALEYYLKLLKCEEKIFNRNTDYPIAGLLGEIGKTYNNLKNYEKALEFYLNVSSLYERFFGAENAWTAWAYKDIAWTYHLAGKYEKALPWAEKAASASPYYESIGPIDTLATVYQDLGRFNEALEKYELCLKLQHEENASEKSIIETEKKIATIKELLKER